MDMNYDSLQQDSYYEHVTKIDVSGKVKQRAFHAMHELEGWCTQSKAAILIDFVLMMKPKTVVEIGVFGGKSLVPMAYALKENGQGKIYGIDPWDSRESVQGMEGVNKDYWGAVNHEAIFRGLVKKIGEFDLHDQIELIRTTSYQAQVNDKIDMLHIDGNHSDETSYFDVTKWVPLVKKGGLIIFDDINWHTTERAVQFLNETCVKLVEFHDSNIWGIWVKP